MNNFFPCFLFSVQFSIVDNDDILVPYPYPSDPMIAEQFYEEYSANKNKPTETDPGKTKTDEKVKYNLSFYSIKYSLA